ncbi:SH3-like domain-containing protein [Allocatelliglobosispora scoriae]|uniref:SH3-like domain-containing protein n=1 Tax=Allocatelliglobosispora scoriae TaxID=643052 RepID=A0A841C369_9ACTN|nr:SH3 domain-containing protein [Allocatelliglobosispora scoriae]MBB5873759.1 SH3-like domain-containing protein [Allocatelliglobosispora scoriae]
MNLRSLQAAGAAVLLGAAMSVVAFATPASAGCARGYYDWDKLPVGKLFDGSNVNIRTGPFLSCGVVGTGQLSHSVDFWCYTTGDTVTRNDETMRTWTFVRDTTNGATGWVADLFLDYNGSGYSC